MTEFELIQQYFSDVGYPADQRCATVDLGVGDDCAVLSIPTDQRLAVSIDTSLVGRHFPVDASADDIAYRALVVAISDLAAMGANPLGFTLALTLPAMDQTWLQQFSCGLRACAQHYHIPLIGGDTTCGPLSVTVQVHGLVPKVTCLQRLGARPGDYVYVSGCLGDAAVALECIQNKPDLRASHSRYLHSRFYQPQARLNLGRALLGLASAAIDVSDGLIADLTHITKASQVGATIYSDALPISEAVNALLEPDRASRCALTGGDDYELCFTAGAEHQQRLSELSCELNVPITKIGEITRGDDVCCLDAQGKQWVFEQTGYRHF